MKNNLLIIISFIILYYLLKNYIPYWNYAVYPINLLVTFLHELGHALWAIITWWWVKSIEINSDGSGYAVTSWWWRPIVLMWWYIGSAIFWNILLWIAFKKKSLVKNTIYILSWLMIFTAIFWYNSIFSSLILFLIAWFFIYITNKTKLDKFLLRFLWIASLLYIIEDFNSWPSSDLAKFTDLFLIIPQVVWMYIWLLLVIFISYKNFKRIIK